MLENKPILEYDDRGKAFLGVQFILSGFDPIRESKVRAKLLDGGGIDAVNYGPDCTHVIVGNLAYDDPVCAAARRDGKILVTGIWVDHSFDLGIPVDPSSVMYTPVRDLNGIPGAKPLVMCLTGYQRQDREDIMTMVGLMGATFSKPLVATKVTHLICYKFEGEKYELAKKVKRIKLVNHRWLEDCLKAWEILPEVNYSKSGYELEMEVEAKDSEDETEDFASKADMERNNIFCPQNTCAENMHSHQQSVMPEVSRKSLSMSASKDLGNVGNSSSIQSISGKEINFKDTSLPREAHNKHLEMSGISNTKSPEKMPSEVHTSPGKQIDFEKSSLPQEAHSKQINMPGSSARSPWNMATEVPYITGDGMAISEKVEHASASGSESVKKSPNGELLKSGIKSYYNNSPPRKSSLPLRIESNSASPSPSNVSKHMVSGGFDLSFERLQDGADAGVKTPSRGMSSLHDDTKTASNNKGKTPCKTPVSREFSKSPMSNHEAKRSMGRKIVARIPELLASGSSIEGSRVLTGDVSPKNVASHGRVLASFSPEGFEKRTSVNLEVKDHSSNKANSFVEMHPSDLQTTEPLLPRTNPGLEKSDGHANVNCLKAGQSDSKLKPANRKLLAKKTLGSHLTNFKTAKKKGFINLKKVVLQNMGTTRPDEALEEKDVNNDIVSDKVNEVPSVTNEELSTGTETEAPDDIRQMESERGKNEEKSAEVEYVEKLLRTKEPLAKSVGDGSSGKSEMVVASAEKTALMESTSGAEEKKLTRGKKRPLPKTRKSKAPREEAKTCDSNNKLVEQKAASGTEEVVSLAGKGKTKTRKKAKRSDDVEKENKPVKQKALINDAGESGEVAPEPLQNPVKVELKAVEANTGSPQRAQNLKVKPEPVSFFILSGHKLQRKEFQKVIKQLKGRVCRDSHNWSYQATHFIVPDPIRRTEKFFAAAASGSWILKTDYLTASNEAGRFLSEEPYEWHKKGLSEDGAINLEAPRKWRLLKKRTGHGAFFGMRIVIYGECISPPLDTLKRVVKAGEGTILATSPPYTRFLKSGIDFAIVSPGMPRVDIWVQEFLNHEVPCVVADYLVDYVCKPGYSLEKHIQYKTHSWAEKSLKNLVSRVEQKEEDSEDVETQEDNGMDEVVCEVCGSGDRGEEMLICGDEKGRKGCGKGMHINCLDPPLEDVPEEDWYCGLCSGEKGESSMGKKTKKGASKSRT